MHRHFVCVLDTSIYYDSMRCNNKKCYCFGDGLDNTKSISHGFEKITRPFRRGWQERLLWMMRYVLYLLKSFFIDTPCGDSVDMASCEVGKGHVTEWMFKWEQDRRQSQKTYVNSCLWTEWCISKVYKHSMVASPIDCMNWWRLTLRFCLHLYEKKARYCIVCYVQQIVYTIAFWLWTAHQEFSSACIRRHRSHASDQLQFKSNEIMSVSYGYAITMRYSNRIMKYVSMDCAVHVSQLVHECSEFLYEESKS